MTLKDIVVGELLHEFGNGQSERSGGNGVLLLVVDNNVVSHRLGKEEIVDGQLQSLSPHSCIADAHADVGLLLRRFVEHRGEFRSQHAVVADAYGDERDEKANDGGPIEESKKQGEIEQTHPEIQTPKGEIPHADKDDEQNRGDTGIEDCPFRFVFHHLPCNECMHHLEEKGDEARREARQQNIALGCCQPKGAQQIENKENDGGIEQLFSPGAFLERVFSK